MPRGISVHVGVNKADPVFQVDVLKGCANDADEMYLLARDRGFEPTKFKDDEAKFENVVPAIEAAAKQLHSGDIFLFTFAGHGSFVPSLLEDDSQDETILLHDCVLIDNYLRRKLWSQFDTGVRILGIADSCHSGTSMLESGSAPAEDVNGNSLTARAALVPTAVAFREFSETDRERIIAERPDIHEEMRTQLAELSEADATLKGTLLTLAACGDFEKARDGSPHGAFTQALLDVLKEPTLPGPPPPPDPPANYDELIARIRTKVAALPPLAGLSQHPVRMPKQADAAFLAQRPFSI